MEDAPTRSARLARRVQAAFGGVRRRSPAPDSGSTESFIEADPSAAPGELRGQMAEHGHLFFRGLLPKDRVLEARREALALCREAGWVTADAGPLEATWSGSAPAPGDDDPEWLAFYRRWVGTPAFNSLPEHPAVMAAAEKLLGDSVLVHQRKIGRVGFPQNEGHQTPPHQDFFHIRGAQETYTAWVPLGDCSQQLGCLTVADGSHKAGFREHVPSSGPGGWKVEAGSEVVWRTQDFAAGDVLMFHSLTMHQAFPNRTKQELRLSLDNRYQRASDPIEPGALKPHVEPASAER